MGEEGVGGGVVGKKGVAAVNGGVGSFTLVGDLVRFFLETTVEKRGDG